MLHGTTLATWLNYITTSRCIDHTVGSKIEYMYRKEGKIVVYMPPTSCEHPIL